MIWRHQVSITKPHSHNEKSYYFRQWQHLPYPDLTPLAGVLFLLVEFFLLTSYPREPSRGLVAIEKVPYAAGGDCFKVSSATQTVISLTREGFISFASSDTTIQRAAIRQVSIKYGVIFSSSQLAELCKLPFLATKVEHLPLFLFTSAAAPYNSSRLEQTDDLDTKQAVACVKAASLFSHSLTTLPAYVFLVIDAKADASKVMGLLDVLEASGIHRFCLTTQSR